LKSLSSLEKYKSLRSIPLLLKKKPKRINLNLLIKSSPLLPLLKQLKVLLLMSRM
jgi:hypothetical protein